MLQAGIVSLYKLFFLWFLQQCMQDLMDGYFPSELQGRFPDGVPLEVCPLLFLFVCEQISKFVTHAPAQTHCAGSRQTG